MIIFIIFFNLNRKINPIFILSGKILKYFFFIKSHPCNILPVFSLAMNAFLKIIYEYKFLTSYVLFQTPQNNMHICNILYSVYIFSFSAYVHKLKTQGFRFQTAYVTVQGANSSYLFENNVECNLAKWSYFIHTILLYIRVEFVGSFIQKFRYPIFIAIHLVAF